MRLIVRLIAPARRHCRRDARRHVAVCDDRGAPHPSRPRRRRAPTASPGISKICSGENPVAQQHAARQGSAGPQLGIAGDPRPRFAPASASPGLRWGKSRAGCVQPPRQRRRARGRPWFAGAWRSAFGRRPRRPACHGPAAGDRAVVATADGDAAVREAWSQIVVVLRVAGAMALAICLLGRRRHCPHAGPTPRRSFDGLRRLEAGEFGRPIDAGAGAREFGRHRPAPSIALAARLAQTSAEARRSPSACSRCRRRSGGRSPATSTRRIRPVPDGDAGLRRRHRGGRRRSRRPRRRRPGDFQNRETHMRRRCGMH